MASTTFSDLYEISGTTTRTSTGATLQLNPTSFYPDPPKNMPDEVKEMLDERKKRVFALELILQRERELLEVYEKLVGG